MQINEDIAWRAVVESSTEFDDKFVYAVRSTGIFCLPSCASRIPLRKNVTFFENEKDATDAGFRACKRCHNASNLSTFKNASK